MDRDSAHRSMLRLALFCSIFAGPTGCSEHGPDGPLSFSDGAADPGATELPSGTPKAAPAGFTVQTAFAGLDLPTVVRFSPDGRVFVAEKRGTVQVYDSLTDTSPTELINVSDEVFSYWDRGLLGMALHPRFPQEPYLYLFYTTEHPGYGPYDDDCSDPTGTSTSSGCIANGRLIEVTVNGNVATVTGPTLEGHWCQRYPSHSVGSLDFGSDGALYVSAGDGASFNFVDYGQYGDPCGDPPGEGGALRSQDLETPSDDVTFDGAILRIAPRTFEALPTNPLASDADTRNDRVIAYGLRNPYRFTVRPNTSELWVGDVGWSTWEEINRIPDPTASVRNFGWPCYEGNDRGGYDGSAICQALYTSNEAIPAVFAYRHGVALDGCPQDPGSTSAVTGLAFYDGGNYPSEYDGSLFFTDLARACVWVMLPGSDGVPSATGVRRFATNVASVGLFRGPGGDIFSVDHYAGTIERFIYSGPGNGSPSAVIAASATSGLAPLQVSFDGAGSSDPDGDPLSYAWDLDGDGQRDDSTDPAPSFTYSTPGTFVVSLLVSDGRGGTAVATVTINVGNEAPVAAIDAPTAATTWRVGDTISFSGHGTDSGQTMAAAQMAWTFDLEHCAPNEPSDCHTHRISSLDGVASGSVTAPDHDYPTNLVLTLTVTDSFGLSDSDSVRLYPLTVDLTFETDPSGLALAVGGTTAAAPFVRSVIIGSTNSVSAISPQTLGGVTYDFASWSDGGAQAHAIVAPATATTYRATYTARPAPNNSPTAVLVADTTSGRAPLTVAFDGSGSSDPDGDALTYRWDLTGDGVFDASGATLSWTYTSGGARTVTLQVEDGRGGTGTAATKIRVRGGGTRN